MYHRIFRKILCVIFSVLFFLLTRVRVLGKDNLPSSGGYLIAANHLSMIEVPLVYCMVNRNDVTGLVARKHHKNLFFRWIVDGLGGIWLRRDEIDTRALRDARDHMKNGGVLGISPEGTRSQTGSLTPAKTGVAFLADQAGVPIVPVAISGTWQITKQVITLQRPIIQVHFGEPFKLPPIDRKKRDADLRNNTEEIMCRIAALLPPEHQGVYADHPRVLELIEQQQVP